MTRPPLTLPAYTPTSWQLRLPGYPVIAGNWRGAELPEILGSMPSEAKWSLVFENKTSDQAHALMLPWSASGGGRLSLTELPDEIAGGVDDEDFRKRLTGTTWTIARKPRKESVKNGRFTVTIELIHELTFESIYGPGRDRALTSTNPVLLRTPAGMAVVGAPSGLLKPYTSRPAVGPALSLALDTGIAVSGQPSQLLQIVRQLAAQDAIGMAAVTGLGVVEANPTKS